MTRRLVTSEEAVARCYNYNNEFKSVEIKYRDGRIESYSLFGDGSMHLGVKLFTILGLAHKQVPNPPGHPDFLYLPKLDARLRVPYLDVQYFANISKAEEFSYGLKLTCLDKVIEPHPADRNSMIQRVNHYVGRLPEYVKFLR